MEFEIVASGHTKQSPAMIPPAPIDRLPTELLALILDRAAEHGKPRYKHCMTSYDQKTMEQLKLVCRRFYEITRGFALHTVRLSWLADCRGASIFEDYSKVQKAHVYRNPTLCRHLVITWDQRSWGPRWMRQLIKTGRLAKQMNNVRCFEFDNRATWPGLPSYVGARFEEKFTAAWDVFGELVAGFDRLQHLVIKRAYLRDVVQTCGKLRRLKTLDLVELWEEHQGFRLSPTVRDLPDTWTSNTNITTHLGLQNRLLHHSPGLQLQRQLECPERPPAMAQSPRTIHLG